MQWRRFCRGPGVLTYSLSGSRGSKCTRTPYPLIVPCCYEWPVIHSTAVLPTEADELCMHADFCSTLNTNVDFIRPFECISCIKMFGSG